MLPADSFFGVTCKLTSTALLVKEDLNTLLGDCRRERDLGRLVLYGYD